ncbi:MAG TPA: hypothetical protein VFX58_18025 [Chitinophagaceae bacterium]|nr:hypothetical protein [Chitinophagaceae bacterium]
MAINKNHEFEELNGVKCAIVEKNASAERVAFLQPLLEFNGYTVVVLASPPAKSPAPAAAAVPAAEGMTPEPASPLPAAPETYTVGVTDVSFNPINAIFGRLLKTPAGKIVTLAYWKQEQKESNDEIPYFEKP